jgi:hypothetical protein
VLLHFPLTVDNKRKKKGNKKENGISDESKFLKKIKEKPSECLVKKKKNFL